MNALGKIAWREKFIATAIHFGVTLALAACAAALIFLVWFPDPFETMIGGTELFMLVVGCDLALGPLISLVIYDSRKSRRELVTDYSIVGTVQLAALASWVRSSLAGTPSRATGFSQASLQKIEHCAWHPPWAAPLQRRLPRRTLFASVRELIGLMVSQDLCARL